MISLAFTVGLVVVCFVVARIKRSSRHLPPGPKPWPVIGNMLDMPSVSQWKIYREWCQRYNSDVIHLHLPREPAVILGSVTAATDLLEKRSQIYSSRLPYVVANIAGWDFNIIVMPYDAKWRAHRKHFHQHFQQSAVGKYMPTQSRHARDFLVRSLQAPEKTREHVRLMITASLAEIVYGKRVHSMDDDYIAMAELGVEGFGKCMIPGVYVMEYLPFLRHIPSWVPGMSVMRMVEKYKPYVIAGRDKPYAEVQAACNAGTPSVSIASDMHEEIRNKYGGTEEENYQHEVARNVACLTYDAGSDTSTSTGQTFLLAMALFPEVQKKAQTELDRVVGPHRLPEFEDLPNLPYIRAVVTESMRWLPVAPFGIPHATTADDTYKGFHIAKGTMIIPNVWAMLNNPEDYPEPEKFIPERFVDQDGNWRNDVRDPTTMVFGFGRRICPGKLFAENSINIFAASTLHVFDITAGVDATGRPLKLSTEIVGELVGRPQDVPCGLKPRSESAAQLIRDLSIHQA